MSQPDHLLPTIPFIGREADLVTIAELLCNPACRLLNLVGPGGIGKTRLALEAARQASFSNGTYFVPLQSVTSPDLIVPAIADHVGIQFYSSADPKQQLLDYLSGKSLLLLLDNFEHLLDGVQLVSEILKVAPGVKLLITARERLNLVEEWVLAVQGLAYPNRDDETEVKDYDAVRLFVQKARRVQVGFALTSANKAAVTRICRLVEGMPLGIELAAASVHALLCEAIADEIQRSLDILETSARNVEPRHRTMRAALEPTLNRLAAEERGVFMRLSVFRGGFTHGAAEYVAGASPHTLLVLVDKSLVRLDADGRYNIHELLRQYGEEWLQASGEADTVQTNDRHCHHYMTFLADTWPRLTGSDVRTALYEIEGELGNVRAAWDWALRYKRGAEIHPALNSLYFFYEERARYIEGERAFARAAAAFSDDAPESIATRARVQARQGSLAHSMALSDTPTHLLRESIQMLRGMEALDDLAFALHRLAIVNLDIQHEFYEAIDHLQESLAIFKALGHGWSIGHVLVWLGSAYYIQYSEQRDIGLLQDAKALVQEGLVVYQQIGSTWGIGIANICLSGITYALGEYERSEQYGEKSLALFQMIGSYWGISQSLIRLGAAACEQSAYARARGHALRGLQLDFEYGLSSATHFTLCHLAIVARIQLGEGETVNAYELLGVIDEQCQRFGTLRTNPDVFVLTLLDADLPPHLAAAVERGKARSFDTVVREVIQDLTSRLEDSTSLTARPSIQPLSDPLTPRELEILLLLSDGLNSREIARHLVFSVGTIRWHLKHIYDKLNAHTRAEAIAQARALKLLT